MEGGAFLLPLQHDSAKNEEDSESDECAELWPAVFDAVAKDGDVGEVEEVVPDGV